MISLENLYIMDLNALHENLYRMAGVGPTTLFNEDRGLVDCTVLNRNGIKVVVANGNGFSAFSNITSIMKKPGKNVWMLKKGALLPDGLRIVKDLRKGHENHYMLAPARNMPYKKYLGLLEELGCDTSKAVLLSRQEVQNG